MVDFVHFPNFFLFLNVYNSETIAAMDLKFGVIILPSSCYTCKQFRASPTSGMGVVSLRVEHVQKSPFYASVWQFTSRDRRLAVVSNIGL